MNTIFKFATVALVAGATSLSAVSVSQAQTSSTGKGGNTPSFGGQGDQPDDSAWLKRTAAKAKNPNAFPPRYGYKIIEPRPKTTCMFLYNQITQKNMLLTVPRYNECMRRGRSQ